MTGSVRCRHPKARPDRQPHRIALGGARSEADFPTYCGGGGNDLAAGRWMVSDDRFTINRVSPASTGTTYFYLVLDERDGAVPQKGGARFGPWLRWRQNELIFDTVEANLQPFNRRGARRVRIGWDQAGSAAEERKLQKPSTKTTELSERTKCGF